MSDIFVSYAQKDRERVVPLVRALEAIGWTVWWDPEGAAGAVLEELVDREIKVAKCMVVVWSANSIGSDWVLGEADDGRKGRILVPVSLDDVDPPRRFRQFNTVSLTSWDGGRDSDVFWRIVAGIQRHTGPPPAGVSAETDTPPTSSVTPRAPEEAQPAADYVGVTETQDEGRGPVPEPRPPTKGSAPSPPPPDATTGGKQKTVIFIASGIAVLVIATMVVMQSQERPSQPSPEVTEPTRSPVADPEPGADAERRARIDELLGAAQRAFTEQRWTTPAGDNAFEYYREVMTLDPDQPEAQTGLERIFNRYMELFALAMEDRQADKAASYLERAEIVNPDAPELIDGRARLQNLSAPEPPPAVESAAEPEVNQGEVFRDRLKDGSPGPEMVVIPGRRYAIGRYEVTFDEYDAFKATGQWLPDDLDWGRGSRPVINVNWHDATAYAEWLSEQTGKRYRLPTEEEWDYANRAGTTTEYWWGDEVGTNNANCAGCGSRWDGKSTAPVGSFKPNPFGLYDTLGNVSEWVGGSFSVITGGSWNGGPRDVYSPPGLRGSYSPDFAYPHVGFRLAQDL